MEWWEPRSLAPALLGLLRLRSHKQHGHTGSNALRPHNSSRWTTNAIPKTKPTFRSRTRRCMMRRFFLFTAFMYFDHTLSKSCFVFSALHNIATSNVNTQACTSPKDAREHTSRLVRTVLHQCAITPRELLQHFKLVERVHLHFLGLQPSVDVVLARAKQGFVRRVYVRRTSLSDSCCRACRAAITRSFHSFARSWSRSTRVSRDCCASNTVARNRRKHARMQASSSRIEVTGVDTSPTTATTTPPPPLPTSVLLSLRRSAFLLKLFHLLHGVKFAQPPRGVLAGLLHRCDGCANDSSTRESLESNNRFALPMSNVLSEGSPERRAPRLRTLRRNWRLQRLLRLGLGRARTLRSFVGVGSGVVVVCRSSDPHLTILMVDTRP